MRESSFYKALPFQLVCVLIAALVLTMIGPYGTYVELQLGRRLAYWTASMLAGWILMVNVAAAIDRIEPLQAWPVAGRMALAGFVGAVPMVGIVWLLEALFRRSLPLEAVPELFMNTTVLAIVVAVAIGQVVEMRLRARAGTAELASPAREQPVVPPGRGALAAPGPPPALPSDPAPAPAGPATAAALPSDAFLRRLPAALGRDLLALEMEDHYARVHTALGSTLVLLRLRDAVAELGEGGGLQVHRSWWVARDAVARTERDGGKLVLVLRNGLRVPVSKTYRDAVKAARWIET